GGTAGKSGAAGKKGGGHNGAAPAASITDRATEHATATGSTATAAGSTGSTAAAGAAGVGGGAVPSMTNAAVVGSVDTALPPTGGLLSDGQMANNSTHGKTTLDNSGLGKVDGLQMTTREATDLLNGMGGQGGMDTTDSNLGMTGTGVPAANTAPVNSTNTSNSMTTNASGMAVTGSAHMCGVGNLMSGGASHMMQTSSTGGGPVPAGNAGQMMGVGALGMDMAALMGGLDPQLGAFGK
ncbi:hypothetical protein BIW11_09663, partial [Tropilaelaps mercedesae]